MTSSVAAGDKLEARLAASLSSRPGAVPIHAWVYFLDKGIHELEKSRVPTNLVSARSLQRRLKVRPAESILDYTDLPVDEGYVAQVASKVLHIRHRSKWINAVSVTALPAQIAQLGLLPFVTKIDEVTQFRHDPSIESPLLPAQSLESVPLERNSGQYQLDYGASLNQLSQINVPALHALGNHAEGVIIGVFDNGFRLLTHHAFDSLRSRIIATYDFVDHKTDVAPNNRNSTFGGHGVNTLSALAAYMPGKLIGPAFGASFILARTENDSSGDTIDFYPSEEDNWIAAIEWADSIGVDVTSTSLGYLDHLPPAPSWTWRDMNGITIPITRAADIAASKGIVVCNAAGNDAINGTPNTLDAPADGFNVLAVGAVYPNGVRAWFSSYGPTVDGRIKPDVMAQGAGVYVASATDTIGYYYQQGTSFSCPLAAGAAALLVKAHPQATPIQILQALRSTASRATTPDNLYGWGILNAVAALNALNTPDTGQTGNTPTTYILWQNYPNPFNPATHINVDLPVVTTLTLKVYDVLGREVATLAAGTRPAGHYVFTWDGTTASGIKASSGIYFSRLDATDATGATHRLVRKMSMVK